MGIGMQSYDKFGFRNALSRCCSKSSINLCSQNYHPRTIYLSSVVHQSKNLTDEVERYICYRAILQILFHAEANSIVRTVLFNIAFETHCIFVLSRLELYRTQSCDVRNSIPLMICVLVRNHLTKSSNSLNIAILATTISCETKNFSRPTTQFVVKSTHIYSRLRANGTRINQIV
jgi:hypothetical protein